VELVMADAREGDPLRDDLRHIQQAGIRAAALTQQLLAFSRRQILRPVVLNLATVISGMRDMLRRLIGEDIHLVVSAPDDLGAVRADPGQIEQVVMNLAVNARDAMTNGGRLSIELQNVDLDQAYVASHPVVKPGPHVMLALSDSGTGMDEATRERIFEPFFTTKGPARGTGLGLSTVYGIVEQSAGSIGVHSEPGVGTTFTIYFPRVEAPAAAANVLRAAEAARGAETVLIVEDEDGVRTLATRILQSAGYTVLVASSGADALRLLADHQGPVDLLLTDVVLPHMSGRDLAHRLDTVKPGVKVLYTSGYTDDAILRHGVLDAETNFIAKPYTRAELTRKVRDVLDM
jgi:CheY-like chemotaxis protein